MRKLTVLAAVAAVLIATPMFAVTRHLTPTPNLSFAPGVGAAGGPTTTNNNDTCDIGTTPAATLLLPYFNVDFSGGNTANTVFTIVNTSRFPQIAHVVLWTDWSFAALDFNIFLTGYDVQSISLRDIFANGQIAPTSTGATGGTSATGSVNGPGSTTNPTLATVQSRNVANGAPGGVPAANCVAGCTGSGAIVTTTNPNFTAAVGTSALNGCLNLPGQIPAALLTDLRTVFTTGAAGTIIGAGCVDRLGGTHANAVGYVTVDVASNCTTNLPGPTYFGSDILFDNVLTGDYEQIVPGTSGGLTNASGGSPLVHIRAIPEGGPSGTAVPTNLPFTFYDRYTVAPTATTIASAAAGARTIDRRQPLPNTFAARWIQGGTGGFNTNYQIWREGLGAPSGNATDCDTANPDVPPANASLAIIDEVRFDEHENAIGVTVQSTVSPALTASPQLPETSSTPTSSSLPFPPAVPTGTDVAGWMYLNLANGGTGASDCRLTFQRGVGVGGTGFGPDNCHRTTTQNWVVVNMQASPSFSALFDATWLGNGCTPAPVTGAAIAPATQRPAAGGTTAGFLVCPPATVCPVPTQPSTPTP